MITGVFESLPVPPSLSTTVTVTVYEPAAAYVCGAWHSRSVPTATVFVVPSPQSIEHVSVSSVPGSTIVASAVTGEPSGYGPAGDSVSVGVGATFSTVSVSLADTGGLTPSVAVNVSVYVPLSSHVTVVDGDVGSAKAQLPDGSDQVVVPSLAVAEIGNAVPSHAVPALPEPVVT